MSNKAIVDKISAIKLNGFEFRLIENNYLSFLKHEEKRVLIIGGGSLEKSKVNNLDSSIHFIEIENFCTEMLSIQVSECICSPRCRSNARSRELINEF